MNKPSRCVRAGRVWLFALAVCSVGAAGAVKPEEKWDVARGTRSARGRFVHRIELRDEAGKIITARSLVPYSPRQTCASGKCHSYETIAKGSHTTMYPDARPDPRFAPSPAWTVYQRISGTQAPLSHGFLPPAEGEADPKLYWTPERFVKDFGAYHPGGGRLEPQLEIDCLVCHARGNYDHVERAREIAEGRFKWAATVGAGLGTVSRGQGELSFEVKYRPTLFDAHGKVDVAVGRPPDRNCLYCHRLPTRGKATWRDCLDADVHSQSGLACADCHRGGPDHVRFGDRRARAVLVKSPEYASLTCEGCHESGRLGSPVPRHEGLPRFHLGKISCEACHSGPRPRVVPLALEQPRDPKWGTPRYLGKPSGPTIWTPVFVGDQAGKIQVVRRLLPSFFARRLEGGKFEPIRLSTLENRFNKVAEQISDDDGDGEPELNTDAEIAAILTALTKKSKRKGRSVDPVYFVGGRAYWLDSSDKDKTKWTLKSEENAASAPIDVPMAHNVRPATQALGATGCLECHAVGSPFWHSIGITRAVGADGQPEGELLHARVGVTTLFLLLGDLGARYVVPYARWVILLAVLAMALHYVVFGPKVHPPEEVQEYVGRFGVLPRLAHFTLLLSFLVLAVTGVCMVSGVDVPLGLRTRDVHGVFGCVLLGSMLLACLGYRGRVPAGRFGAVERLFLWLIGLVVVCQAATGGMLMFEVSPRHWLPLVYIVHKVCAYFMIVAVPGYVYLGTAANPGTIGAPFTGRVTRAWLQYHHPDHEPKDKRQR